MKKGDLVWVSDSLDGVERLRVYECKGSTRFPFTCKAYNSELPETPENVRTYSTHILSGWKYCRPYQEAPVKGDLVWVGDSEQQVKNREAKRVFMADVGGKMPIIVTSPEKDNPTTQDLLDEYNSGDYYTTSWNFCEKVSEEPAKELTVGDIENLLGYPVKIIGETK